MHATTVRIADRGVIIFGPSGAGKSALAVQLIGLGAQLVADDRTQVSAVAQVLMADAPSTISGMIEARGVGILRMAAAGSTPLALAVDLGKTEADRLPEPHLHHILGQALPCLYRVDAPHFASAILLYLRCSINVAP